MTKQNEKSTGEQAVAAAVEAEIRSLLGNALPVTAFGANVKGPALNKGDLLLLKLWNTVQVVTGEGDTAKKVNKTLKAWSRVRFDGAQVGNGPMLDKPVSYKCSNPAGVVTGDEAWAQKMWFTLEDGSVLGMPVLSTPAASGGDGGGALCLSAKNPNRKRVTFTTAPDGERAIWADSMAKLNALNAQLEEAQIEQAEAQAEAEAAVAEQQAEALIEQAIEQVPAETTDYVDHAGGTLDNTLSVAPVEQVTAPVQVEQAEAPKPESKTEKRARLKAEAEAKRAAEQAEKAGNGEPVAEAG